MNKFDRIKVTVRGVQVLITAPSSFEELRGVSLQTGQTLFTNFKLKKEVLANIVGLIGLFINQTTGEVTLDFTGKLLPAEYKNLINKENILKYIERVNELGLVEFDIQDFLQKSKVRLLHSTIDVQVEESKVKYLNYLNHLVTKKETSFEAKRYNNGNVDLKRKADTNRQAVTGYDKNKELMRRNTSSVLFRESLSEVDNKYFEQVIRFERKLSNTRAIYSAFNITPRYNSLLNILHSDISPVVNTLNTLFDELGVPNV